MAASNSIASSAPDQRQLRLIAAAAQANDARIRDILAEEPHGWSSTADRDALRQSLQKVAARGRLDLVRLLLSHGADPDAKPGRDNEIPAVFKAAEGAHAAVVAELLAKGADPDWSHPRTGQTALYVAAARGHNEVVKALLEGGAAVDGPRKDTRESDKLDGRTPLLYLASEKKADKWNVDTLRLLVDAGASLRGQGPERPHPAALGPPRRAISGTPGHMVVDCAFREEPILLKRTTAFNGHEAAVALLLARPEADLSIKDSFYRTPMLCAAEKHHADVVRMLSPTGAADRLSPAARGACEQFEATVVDFGDFAKKQMVFRHSVYEVLYGDKVPTITKHIKYEPSFRWIHLPANNLAWVETLIAKHFVESGHRDIEAYKSLERCFDQEHCGPLAHDNFMRLFSQRIPASQRLRPDKDEKPLTALAEESSEMSTTAAVASLSGSDIISPKNSPRPDKQSFQPPNKALGRADTGSSAATPRSEGGKKKSKAEQLAERHPKSRKRTNGPPGNAPGTKQRAMAQTALSLPWENSRLVAPSGSLVLFMPFLHYETDKSRKDMAKVIDTVHREQTEAMDKTHEEQMELLDHATPDELLIRGYLCHKPPLHPRRTLDQYFYHGIDTTQRDEDQVVYRYCLNNDKPLKVFMVDQLWLWVINRNLIITCFPQRWEQPKHDPFNVLDGIIEETNAKTRPPVQSVYDLAMLITNRCAGLFDRHRMDDQNYQFLEMFESSIGHVTDEESKLFVRFNRASELSGRLRRELLREGTSLLSAPTRRSRQGESGGEEDDDRDPADELLEIGHETELLAEIKDIRDELNILDTVLDGQYQLLKDFEQHVEEELRASTAADPSARRATDMFVAECRRRSAYQGRLLETRLGDIERMDRQAQSILYSLTNLLDLKQKHSNALEARFARDQAVIAAKQGQTVMVFTLVTILFLPISFIAAFFAINFSEWGTEKLTIPYVAKYMFGVGLGISVPLIIMAFTITDIIAAVKGFFISVRDRIVEFYRLATGQSRKGRKAELDRRKSFASQRSGKRGDNGDEDGPVLGDKATVRMSTSR
ncbi:ankyrin repeat and protein kinase domain-containing protein 1, partial [Magnaporthiopsis poae ATCC 64411]